MAAIVSEDDSLPSAWYYPTLDSDEVICSAMQERRRNRKRAFSQHHSRHTFRTRAGGLVVQRDYAASPNPTIAPRYIRIVTALNMPVVWDMVLRIAARLRDLLLGR